MQKFFIGDVVKYQGDRKYWRQNSIHIITEAEYRGKGEFEYATNKGAWFNDSDFVLVRRANPASFKTVDAYLQGS